MPEESCATDASTYVAVNGPIGDGPPQLARTAERTGQVDDLLDAVAAVSNKVKTIEELAAMSASDAVQPGTPVTPGEARAARSGARRYVEFFEAASEGRKKLFEDAREIELQLGGSRRADITAWMNFQNLVSKKFVNERNDMVLWWDSVSRMDNTPAYQHVAIQRFNNMLPKIRGMAALFEENKTKLMDKLTPIARKTGYSNDEVFDFIGFYLCARHAPERNAHLMKGWGEELKGLVEKAKAAVRGGPKLTEAEIKRAAELDEKIAHLKENLDNTDPPDTLFSAGYTNAQAEALRADIMKKLGMTEAELDPLAKELSGQFDFITRELANAGALAPEQAKAIPDFEWYTPMFNRDMNMDEAVNTSTHYVPGSRQAADGMMGRPDSAAQTLNFFAHRAATEIGMQDYATALAAMHAVLKGRGDKDTGLKSVSYRELMGAANNPDYNRRRWADRVLGAGGIVANVPVRNTDGSVTIQQRYMYFDPNYKNGTLTGKSLNEALSSNYKLGSKLFENTAKATSFASQSVTRFSPLFAPVSGTRDIMERLFHTITRDYTLADGTVINGTDVSRGMLNNVPRAGQMLSEVLTGKAAPDSVGAMMFEEFRREGGLMKYTPGVRQEGKTLEDLVARSGGAERYLRDMGVDKAADVAHVINNNPVWKRVLTEGGAVGRQAMKVIDGWNDWCQTIAPFAHYLTLREMGMDAKRAGAAVTEMMNMTHRGTVGHALSVIAPFVRPTMQGALAFARSMGLHGRNAQEIFQYGKKGWITGLAASAAFGTLMPLIRNSLGEDENGRSRLDAMPISQATSSLPIGLDDQGRMLKLPIGFGPVRVAMALSMAMDRVWRGLIDPAEGAAEVMFAAARDTVPGNHPGFSFGDKPFEYVMQMVTPMTLLPFLEVASNTNHFGSEIYNAYDKDKALANQGRKSTPGIWHNVARYVLKQTGMDVSPEVYRHLAKGIMLGPGRMLSNAAVAFAEDGEAYKGWNKPTAFNEMNPALAAIGGTLWYGKVQNIDQMYYYKAANELMEKVKRAGVKLTQDGLRGEEGAEAIRAKLEAAGFDASDTADILTYHETNKALMGLGREFNALHPNWYEEEDMEKLKADFADLKEKSDRLYTQFVSNANYYKGKI